MTHIVYGLVLFALAGWLVYGRLLQGLAPVVALLGVVSLGVGIRNLYIEAEESRRPISYGEVVESVEGPGCFWRFEEARVVGIDQLDRGYTVEYVEALYGGAGPTIRVTRQVPVYCIQRVGR